MRAINYWASGFVLFNEMDQEKYHKKCCLSATSQLTVAKLGERWKIPQGTEGEAAGRDIAKSEGEDTYKKGIKDGNDVVL